MDSLGIVEVRVFLMLVWVSFALVILTGIFYKLHLQKAVKAVSSLGIASLILAAWAYLSIWNVR